MEDLSIARLANDPTTAPVAGTSCRAACARSLAQAWMRASSGPSSMIRSLGSVPLQRMRTRPSWPSEALISSVAFDRCVISSSGRRAGSITFSSTWGTRSMASRASSERGLPVRIIRASTWSAPMMPSPVEAWSRKIRCPDCSPPRLKPPLRMASTT